MPMRAIVLTKMVRRLNYLLPQKTPPKSELCLRFSFPFPHAKYLFGKSQPSASLKVAALWPTSPQALEMLCDILTVRWQLQKSTFVERGEKRMADIVNTLMSGTVGVGRWWDSSRNRLLPGGLTSMFVIRWLFLTPQAPSHAGRLRGFCWVSERPETTFQPITLKVDLLCAALSSFLCGKGLRESSLEGMIDSATQTS